MRVELWGEGCGTGGDGDPGGAAAGGVDYVVEQDFLVTFGGNGCIGSGEYGRRCSVVQQ